MDKYIEILIQHPAIQQFKKVNRELVVVKAYIILNESRPSFHSTYVKKYAQTLCLDESDYTTLKDAFDRYYDAYTDIKRYATREGSGYACIPELDRPVLKAITGLTNFLLIVPIAYQSILEDPNNGWFFTRFLRDFYGMEDVCLSYSETYNANINAAANNQEALAICYKEIQDYWDSEVARDARLTENLRKYGLRWLLPIDIR